jgi:hypothetical protein
MKKILVVIGLGIITHNVFSQAKYFFNGNAKDVGGNKLHGVVNNCKLVKDRWGIDSSAYEFNGTNSYIKISDVNKLIAYRSWYATMGKAPTPPLTISFWFKPYQVMSSKDMVLVERGNDTSLNYSVRIENKKVRVLRKLGDPISQHTDPTEILNPNQWYFVQVEMGPIWGAYRMYQNVQLNCNNKNIWAECNTKHWGILGYVSDIKDETTVYIGCSKDKDKYFYGIIDDVQFTQYSSADCKDKPTSEDSLVINKTVYKYKCVNTTYDTVKVYAPIFYNDTTRVTVYDTVLTPYYYDVPVCLKTIYDTVTTYDTIRINQIVKNKDTMFIKWKTGSGIEATAGTGMLSKQDIKVFPNPTSTNITIDCSGMNVNTYVNIVLLRDINGNIIRSYEGHFYTLDNYKRIEINMSDLLSKVYVLEVIDNFGNRMNMTIIKQ